MPPVPVPVPLLMPLLMPVPVPVPLSVPTPTPPTATASWRRTTHPMRAPLLPLLQWTPRLPCLFLAPLTTQAAPPCSPSAYACFKWVKNAAQWRCGTTRFRHLLLHRKPAMLAFVYWTLSVS
jgi:hypothetical protein